MADMIIVNGVRYRAEDAKRLGLVSDGKVVTKKSTRRKSTPKATKQEPDPTPPQSNDDASDNADGTDGDDVEKPAGNASRADWEEFALAQGTDEADLEGKSRDDIAAMFAESAE